MPPPITNVFVLMLENRSFDHMLGFSGITGTDAATGQTTTVNGLQGTESNLYQGHSYAVAQPALDTMPVDPGHEFPDVLTQLCGPGAPYQAGGAYPAIDNSGFVADYAASPSPHEGNAPGNFGGIMKCCSPAQLPVLNALARAFAVCDNWFAAIPGPTWPNRFFAHAASSGGLDHSPTPIEIAEWDAVGFGFPNGTIFAALETKFAGNAWRIFAGDAFPNVGALRGISLGAISSFDYFPAAVADPNYPWAYTWIEPNYGNVANDTFEGGNSQHPLDGLAQGEALIKKTYEAIRNSPHWATSLLVVTWDEHGGFYDHVAPPGATPPGDTQPGSKHNQYGFTFGQYGVRVPAIVASPLIPPNLIDHRIYDHSSIPKTIETIFGLPALTARDAAANDVTPLLSLATARGDAPASLPNPAAPAAPLMAMRAAPPDASIDKSLPGFLHVAMRHDIALSPPEAQPAILARVQAIQTRAQAAQYLDEVGAKVHARWAEG